MKKNIILLITLFIASTLLVAAEPLAKKSKMEDKFEEIQLNKVRPSTKKSISKNIVKPMKKKLRNPSEIQTQLELLRKNFENEKLSINNEYKRNLKMLKSRKHDALEELKAEYNKRKRLLRNKY
jgi:hypothetical protein